MDKKLLIGGVVAAILVLGGVAYAVSKGGPAPVAPESIVRPAEQLRDEMPKGDNGGTRIVPKMPDGKPLPM